MPRRRDIAIGAGVAAALAGIAFLMLRARAQQPLPGQPPPPGAVPPDGALRVSVSVS